MVRVFHEKFNIKACTYFTAGSLPSPDWLMHDSHCVCQAEKSEPRLICRFNLGRSPWQKNTTTVTWEISGEQNGGNKQNT